MWHIPYRRQTNRDAAHGIFRDANNTRFTQTDIFLSLTDKIFGL